MCDLLSIVALWATVSAAPAAPACLTTVEVQDPESPAQPGPRCLTAATATAISAQPDAPAEPALARSVRVTPAGIDPFDLQQALRPLGWDSLVFTGPPEAAARLVEAGFAPVAMVDLGGGRKHAVAVTGAERVSAAADTCSTALARLQTIDPRDGTPRWETARAFADRQWAQQLLVVYRPVEAHRLDDAGFPLAAAQAVNARFEAEGHLRRAEAHPAPNAQSVRLLELAVAADPGWVPAAAALHEHRAALPGSSTESP